MSPDRSAFAASLVEEYLGSRLDAAGDPPGLRDATVELAALALDGDASSLIHAQLRHLSPRSGRFPDAYLADEASAEDALQRAAAGLRTALARAGRLVDPRPFEQRAAARLRDDPRLAVRAELARVPRPVTRPEPLRWSVDPAPWSDVRSGDDQDLWPPPGLAAVEPLRFLPGGATTLAQVEDGPHAGWTQIGMVERHYTPARRYPDRSAREVLIAIGLEITDTDPPAGSLPFARSPWQMWTVAWQRLDPSADADAATQRLAHNCLPAVALTDAGRTDPDHVRTGLGLPLYVLAPVFSLVAALRLEPTSGICGFSLSDETGPGLVCRQWRGHLVHDGNYEPLMPAIEGADLLIRPDLFALLRHMAGDARVRTGVAVSHRTGFETADDDE